VYKRRPDGEVILEPKEYVENIRRNGVATIRRITRREKAIDNDLPVIAQRYREFRKAHAEPGELQ
jgi:type I restriction enzyme M protein